MSSSSSFSASSPPEPSRQKRKREDKDVNSESDNSNTDSGSDSGSESENENNKPITPAGEEDESPVLSHAAKRKQKKQGKILMKQKDSGAPEKRRKLKDGTAAASTKEAANGKGTRRQNSVWVGNMSFKVTEENLRTFFKDRGAGEVTRVNMPTKVAVGPGNRAENRGFAYVDFETPEAKQAAIGLSEQPLLGRKLLIKDGDDYTGRPDQHTVETTVTVNGVKRSLSKTAQKILKDQKQPPAPTLFFGNLSFDTTEDSIRELLEAHREKGKQKGKAKDETPKEEEEKKGEPWIRKVRLGTFEDSGKCKGFGFVDFTATDFATSALINPKNHHLNGRALVVEYAGAEAVRRGAPKTQKQKFHGDTSAPAERAESKLRTKRDLPPHNTRPIGGEAMTRQVDVPKDDTTPRSVRKPSLPEGGQGNRQRDKGRPRGRPKPGAALALAKRENAAIVPSQGQKITF